MHKGIRVAVASFALLAIVGCGGMWTMKSKEEKPSPMASPDKATLVIMRTTSYGFAAKVENYLDGKLIGQTKGKCYFFTKIDPGQHLLICKNENMRPHQINFEAGKVYYLQQAIYMGAWSARTEYDTLNPAKFEEQKPECDFLVLSPSEIPSDAGIDIKEAMRERADQMKDEAEYYAKIDNVKGY